MTHPGGEDRDSERQQSAALTQERRQEGNSTGRARDHASGASREDDWGSSLPAEWVSADKEAWSQLPQEGSSTGRARDDASDAFPDMEGVGWEQLAKEDQAAWLQLAQEEQAAQLQLAREKERSASSDHLPGSEAPSRVEDTLSKWARKGFAWARKRLSQATGSRDGDLEWHSWIRRDRAPEKREKTPTKARKDPQPVSSKGKGKESADKIPDWATVLQEARASAPQQPAQVVESAEVARPNSPHPKEEKRRRIAAKEKELTESRGGAEVKGKDKENGNGGMSF
jgi:hypothetical protein